MRVRTPWDCLEEYTRDKVFQSQDSLLLVNFFKGSLINDLVPFLILPPGPVGGAGRACPPGVQGKGPGCHFPERVPPHPAWVALRAPPGGVFPQLSFLTLRTTDRGDELECVV